MINAVLFDMDGLIFDTESIYKTSWQYAAKEQGLKLSDALYQHFIGVPDAACEQMLVQHLGAELDLPRYQAVRDKHFHALCAAGVTYQPGFTELFGYLQQRAIRCALVTSSGMAEVKHYFSGSPFLEQFERVITSEDVSRGKPYPDCYLLACEGLVLPPAECLVLEDSNNGMQAALDAGCQAIMIPDMLQANDEVKRRAKHILTSLREVIPLL
ncbi:HAD family phosphatase [Agarivorans sp. 1_MG-2023]|uniref:HAD family hydrolase n=1 Tax=Agarivorans sp. 1_MG-2023 TaxID=3062634 RepID=UPI0026E28FF4|nr:HAD family phosphatase [Agarivorans sp. 1_MG-2023]MDO6764295.1 HAD family phosphatase [Agarivorans sp. 1_MG-2023]